jgi:histone H3/H4
MAEKKKAFFSKAPIRRLMKAEGADLVLKENYFDLEKVQNKDQVILSC